MAFSLDSTPSSPTFNCYLSVTEATDYFDGRFGADKWNDFNIAQQQALLVSASREIDNLRFGGSKTLSTQPMSWPRADLEDYDGNDIDETAIPVKLKYAVCELALWKWTEEDRWFSDIDLGQISSYKVPGVEVTAKNNPDTLPSIVVGMIDAIGPNVAQLPIKAKAKSMRIGL